jgi:hypothetical protein
MKEQAKRDGYKVVLKKAMRKQGPNANAMLKLLQSLLPK